MRGSPLQARDASALDALTARLNELGVPTLWAEPEEAGLEQALRFKAPAGHVIEVFTTMTSAVSAHTGAGVPPRKFGHRC